MNAAPNWKPCKALRSPEWLQYVRSLPSVVSGMRGCVAHHLIGNGRLSNLKTSDYLAFPLTDEEHRGLHDKGWTVWELKHGPQLFHSYETLRQGIRDGVLVWREGGLTQRADMDAMELEAAIRAGDLVLDKRAAKYIGGE